MGALIVPLLMGVSGVFAWMVKSRLEEIRMAQDRLASDRRKLYTELLLPYIKALAGEKAGVDLKELEGNILSVDFRKTSFEVMLIGSDDVVLAYNDLIQYFYQAQPGSASKPFEALRLYGVLLLAIRKSVGNSTTKLDEWDMLRHMINDLDRVLPRLGIESAQMRRLRKAARRSPPRAPEPAISPSHLSRRRHS